MTDNFSNDENALFKAQIREADLASQAELQEIQGAADELARQKILNKLRQAEVEHEELRLKLAREASGGVNNILSYVELSAAENEENFTSGIGGLLAKLFKFFNFMDSELGVETDPQVYRMIKKREEEEKQEWVATVIKFLRDKFNKLIKAIFSRDLSFQQKLDQEIEKLFERLFDGSLSPEEEAAILERLEALQNLKLKLQMFVVGSVVTMFAELFSVKLTASVETTKEEGKEKTSAKEKEATKEVHEIMEIKVDSKEKPTVIVPVSFFDFSSGVARPITLTKQELDLLSASLKNLVHSVHKDDMNKGNSVVPKQEVKEKQGQENKKAKSEAPKKDGRLTEVSGKKKLEEQKRKEPYRCNSDKEEIKNQNKNNIYKEFLNQPSQGFASKQPVKSSVANDECDFGLWSNAGAKNEPQQSSVDNAQPKSECSSVKINSHVDSIGKAQEEASRGSRTM